MYILRPMIHIEPNLFHICSKISSMRTPEIDSTVEFVNNQQHIIHSYMCSHPRTHSVMM